MAAVRHFEFAKFWYFVTWPSLEPKSAVAHQISLKSDDPRLRRDETIFKMAAARHLEFSKIAIFVTWPVSEHGSTCTYHIPRQSDNNSWCYCLTLRISSGYRSIRFSIWQLSAILNFIFCFINQHVTDIEPKFQSPHQISSKSDDSRPIYSDKTIFEMAAVRHLEFSKFGILVTWPVSERDFASSNKISR